MSVCSRRHLSVCRLKIICRLFLQIASFFFCVNASSYFIVQSLITQVHKKENRARLLILVHVWIIFLKSTPLRHRLSSLFSINTQCLHVSSVIIKKMFVEVILAFSAIFVIAFTKFLLSNWKFYSLAAKIPSIKGHLPCTIGFAHKAVGANSEGDVFLWKGDIKAEISNSDFKTCSVFTQPSQQKVNHRANIGSGQPSWWLSSTTQNNSKLFLHRKIASTSLNQSTKSINFFQGMVVANGDT